MTNKNFCIFKSLGFPALRRGLGEEAGNLDMKGG